MFALIFPGQGAQYVGMGKDFYDNFPEAKKVFHRADEALGFELSKVIFHGPDSELLKSENCSPGILVTSIACLEAVKSRLGFMPKFAAGLSLGEYTALVASNTISLEDGVRLVKRRGIFMDEASKINPGTMVAVIGLETDKALEVCRQTGCEIANLNAPGQVVLSGKFDAIEKASKICVENGAKRAIPLDVGGAYHSSLMKPGQQKLTKELDSVEINISKTKVISNFTARPQEDSDEIRSNLAKQLISTTRWNDSVNYMAAEGVNHFYEIGPGNVLKGLLRKINSQLKVINIGRVEDLKDLEVNKVQPEV